MLTAAHCVYNRQPSSFSVVVNEINYQVLSIYWSIQKRKVSIKFLDQVADGEISMSVAQIKIHNTYNQSSFQDNDFALLRLATPVPLSNTVGIACIAPDIVYDGKTVIITGWGYTTPNGPQSPTLKQANVVTMANTACAASGLSVLNFENKNFSRLASFFRSCL